VRIGAGAFGEVFRGFCLGQPVAIKTMLEVSDAGARAFRAEILLTATLRHPNIVQFVGACWGRELTCLVSSRSLINEQLHAFFMLFINKIFECCACYLAWVFLVALCRFACRC